MTSAHQSGVFRLPTCAKCKRIVEQPRRSWALPHCLTCLPHHPVDDEPIDIDGLLKEFLAAAESEML